MILFTKPSGHGVYRFFSNLLITIHEAFVMSITYRIESYTVLRGEDGKVKPVENFVQSKASKLMNRKQKHEAEDLTEYYSSFLV